MSILVVGSVAMDTIKTPFGEAQDLLGGSATYFSIAASLFDRVNLVAVVGKDMPEDMLKVLGSRDIDLSGLVVKDGLTFRWGGEYQDDLNTRRTINLQLNVFEGFKPRVPEDFTASPYVFLANMDPEIQMDVLRQVTSPKLIACDTIDFWIETKRDPFLELLKKVDILFLNEEEARALSGELNPPLAIRRISERGPRMVVVKKGAHGVLMLAGGSYFATTAYPLEKVLDPTGAGDSFAGGFLGYLARKGTIDEESLRLAVVYGSVLASFCVEDFGVERLAQVEPDQMEARFNDFKELTRF